MLVSPWKREQKRQIHTEKEHGPTDDRHTSSLYETPFEQNSGRTNECEKPRW